MAKLEKKIYAVINIENYKISKFGRKEDCYDWLSKFVSLGDSAFLYKVIALPNKTMQEIYEMKDGVLILTNLEQKLFQLGYEYDSDTGGGYQYFRKYRNRNLCIVINYDKTNIKFHYLQDLFIQSREDINTSKEIYDVFEKQLKELGYYD